MRSTRWWTLVVALAAVASAVPLWCVEILPFSDIPEQLAVIATLRHWGEPAFSGPYVFDIGKSQYVLYHLVGALLAIPLGSAELANRVLLTLVALATPFALRSLLRALDRDERLALFAVSAFWTRPLMMGFLPYVAAMPVVIWGLALAVREWEQPKRARALGLACLALALFFLHVDPFVLFVLAALLMRATLVARAVAVEGERVARAAISGVRQLAWLAPALGTAAAWSAFGSLRGSMTERGVGFIALGALVKELPAWSHDIWRSHVDEACSIVVWAAFTLLVVQRGARAADRWKTALAAGPFIASIACYFLLPYNVGPAVMLNVRIAVFVSLFLALIVERIDGKRAAVPLAAVAIASVVLSCDVVKELRRIQDEELGTTSRLLDRLPPGAKILTLPFHVVSPRTHWAPWTFLGAYHRVRHGGVASFSFSEIDHWPLHYRPPEAPPPKPLFWTFNACGYRNAVDGLYYDYVLARGNVDPFRDAPPGPVFERVGGDRDFVLYARVPGKTNPRWKDVDDGGPCESRRSLELKERHGLVPAPE